MNISLSRMVFGLGALNIIALMFLAGAFFLFKSSQTDVSRTYENQYRSYLLADELRQSSDDLTRLARTYVITGDAKYEVQYFDILDIRNGKKPRPADYHRIYWDFIAADLPKPRKDTVTVPLDELMKNAGFTDAEFKFLSQAQANSDGLVGLEVKAMNAVKGLFDNGSGQYTVNKDPDFKLARELMHSNDYHKFKANIMTPVDKFFVALENRTSTEINAAENLSVFYGSVALVALIIVAIVAAITFWMILTRVIGRLDGMKEAMLELSNENMECEIPDVDHNDEIGDMASAVQVFKDGMLERRGLRAEAERVAQEQADREDQDRKRIANEEAEAREKEAQENRVTEERANRILSTITAFEKKVSELLGTLTGAATELQSTADGLVDTADGSRALSSEVATASKEASANVQTVASAAEELSASIREINRQVDQASNVSQDAVQRAEDTTTSISKLADAAKKISEVVNMISDIAGQTNLLALNATIEAARAGDAGKGFAVVASEVKSLATQTAKATDEITTQISGMQVATEGAVSAIGNIGEVIRSIREATVSISSAVTEQNSATDEISRSVQEASRGTNQVSEKIGEVSTKSHETGSAASDVQNASKSLDQLAHSLKADIESFLTEMRAA